MKVKNGAIGILAAALAIGPTILVAQGPPPPPPPPPGYAPQGGGWENPPSEYQAIAQQGYRDGVRGARKDYENHRRPDVNNRDEYRHPNVPGHDRQEYRDAFYRGYQAGVDHLMNGYR